MIKSNLTNYGFVGFIEKIIRSFPVLYFFFRSIAKYVNYFEKDFYELKKIFKLKKINILDIGASDGISTLFFFKHLNVEKIICYEPQKNFFNTLKKLKKKYRKLVIKNHGLGYGRSKLKIYYPFFKIFGKKIILYTYSFPKKEELISQIQMDFLVKPRICSEKLLIKKFKLIKQKIDLIKIDTNGSETKIVRSLIPQISRDKPYLIIENYKIFNILKILKKFNYKIYNSKDFKNTAKLNVILHSKGNSKA